ncbi:MAG: CoA transferase, partial [Gammaproteobacteria bacterium]|nr:CoA transferase [Gammaproteobacteria bacterium]
GPVRLETSIFESCLCFSDVGVVTAFNTGLLAPRLGVNRFPPTYPLGVFPCRDGWLGVTVLTPSQWHAFCELLELDDLADVPLFQTSIERLRSIDVLEPLIREKLLLHSAEELFYRGQEAGIPLARVPTMEELFGVDQFLHRKAFADAILPDGFRLQTPTVPFRLFSTPPNFGGPVARLGEHTEAHANESLAAASPSSALSKLRTPPSRRALGEAHSATKAQPTTPGALTGIRVIDLSMGWAGPLATRHLADLGADVIKVEGLERFDWWRSWEATEEWIADDGAEKASNFNAVNRNKRGITLELEHPEGRALLLRLIGEADAVVENFSGGVLPKLNLGYEQFRKVKDDIILLSMPAFGTTGPWSRLRAYGSTVEHASGLPHLNGFGEDPPTMHHVAYGDAVGGLNGAAALLVALNHLTHTGEGQFVDLSQAEALFPLAVHGIVHYAATGGAPPRKGNRSAPYAPHGVYPCRGEDQWILIQAGEESEWRALKRESAGRLDGFDDLEERLRRVDSLDDAIAAWTAQCDSRRLMTQLQSAGVPAATAHDLASLFDDPHLAARGFWQWLDRAVVGRQPHPSPPYRRGSAPLPITRPAPTLGQHNMDVLGGILGVGDAELASLEKVGIIGTKPRIRSP